MRIRHLAVGASLVLSLSAAWLTTASAAITYNVDLPVGNGSVVGTITTNGAIGVLAAADVTSWNLVLSGVGASYDLSNFDAGSAISLLGNDVTATARDLYFNFSGTSGDLFLLQDNYSSGDTYFCDAVSGGTCLKGESDVPQYYSDSSAQFDHGIEGTQIIGVAGAPEPAAWAMLALGIGAIGSVLRRRQKLVFASL